MALHLIAPVSEGRREIPPVTEASVAAAKLACLRERAKVTEVGVA